MKYIPEYENVGNLKTLVKEIGLGQKRLAAMLGVPHSTFRAWLCGARTMPEVRYYQLLDINKRFKFQKWQIDFMVKNTSGETPDEGEVQDGV
jgi:transcriptional regulator with XRE-family HTH domain